MAIGYPLTVNIYSGVAGAPQLPARLLAVRANWIPTESTRRTTGSGLELGCVGRFIFAAGTDVRDDMPLSPPAAMIVPGNFSDLIECPVGSIAVLGYWVACVLDSFPTTGGEYRTAWVWRRLPNPTLQPLPRLT